MSKIAEGFRAYFRPEDTTQREIGGYVTEDVTDRIIARLEKSGYSDLGKVCYVFGAGKHPKSTFTDLGRRDGIQLVYFESVLPRGLRFIPSYRGLAKMKKESAIGEAMRKLMEQSTVITLIFDAALEESFVESVRLIDKHGDHSFGIKNDPGYLIYLIDADRDDSPTGIAHFLSYGTHGPWKDVFEDLPELNDGK